ncbi:hypothetical protein NDU88_004037 [Pleurodeles waltl]|uniref:Uncharacterized protein n=1 Tax=Pleurodeles waltl TaxID=8319 RepID=A0AAV7L073_PLEWA|nr:hypothetical protein NDU88_004037 [Pleurodeles waltl]
MQEGRGSGAGAGGDGILHSHAGPMGPRAQARRRRDEENWVRADYFRRHRGSQKRSLERQVRGSVSGRGCGMERRGSGDGEAQLAIEKRDRHK